MAGSGPVPWRQAPSLFNSIPQTELHQRVPYDVDLSSSIDRHNVGERLTSPLEKRKIDDFSDRLMNGGAVKGGSRNVLENGNASGKFLA